MSQLSFLRPHCLAVFAAVAALASSLPSASAVEHAEVCRYCRHAGLHAAPEHPDPKRGERKYAPDRQVDVKHIKLDVTPDFDNRTVSGTATLRFVPIAEPVSSLRLDAVNLDVRDVRSKEKIRDWSAGRKELTVVFDPPLPVGEEASIEVEYSAEPNEGLYFRTPEMGLPEEDVHVWTQGETHEARHWFPSFDYPNERSSTEIICHVPKEMTVVSNGRLVKETEDGDMKTVHWLQEKPHVSYLICFVAGKLEKIESSHGDVPLGFYSQPSKAKHAAEAFEDTADIMAFFDEEIGVPYPWEKYDQATITDFTWGGMENTTITTLTQRTLHSPEVENVQDYRTRTLNAHEMAHQWFGDYVTCKDWSHLWLNEGFATYYAHLYEGHKFGRDALLYGLYIDARDEIFLDENKNDKRPIVYREYESEREQFDFRNYPKASWVLHMLRSQLGEEMYREAIHTYLERHALSEVETEDLREVFEELSGKPLDRFFDQWLYHGGQPELKVTYRWRGKEQLAQVTVEQTQETGDDVLLFEFPTKLRFVVDGEIIDEAVEIKERKHDFFVRLPAEPQVVRFDPDYSVLAKVDFKLSDALLKAQLKDKSDAMGRVLACEGLAERKTKSSVAALSEALQEDSFFGVREAAALALRKIGTEEAVAALAAGCDQDDARVRLRVVDELGKCYRDEAHDKLLDIAAKEKNPAVRAAAIRGLGKYQGEKTVAAVREALESKSFNNEPVLAAFMAIRDLGDRSLAADLMNTLSEREQELDPRDFTEGMITLAQVSQRGRGRNRAFEFLKGYLDHPRIPLRTAAVRALGELGDARARPLLEAYAADASARVAPTAKAALEQLTKTAPLAPTEVSELRRELRELRDSQDKLQKAVDDLKSKSAAKPAKASSDAEAAESDDEQ
jgi:aminopeptidase N